MVGQCEGAVIRGDFLQQRRDELIQVIDLLELAPGVLVEPALAREDVQFLEQLDGLTGPDLFNGLFGWSARFAGGPGGA